MTWLPPLMVFFGIRSVSRMVFVDAPEISCPFFFLIWRGAVHGRAFPNAHRVPTCPGCLMCALWIRSRTSVKRHFGGELLGISQEIGAEVSWQVAVRKEASSEKGFSGGYVLVPCPVT